MKRSIPACAGEPSCARTYRRYPWVYPRVCGGTSTAADSDSVSIGLSPRVRGNRTTPPKRNANLRSIPACAGEPLESPPQCCGSQVYPRVCGGTPSTLGAAGSIGGLSPRVRGNRPLWPPRCRRGGSIPACAGEPWQLFAARVSVWVYPRVCGGTRTRQNGPGGKSGLSPRVRGNRNKGQSKG